MRQFTFVRVLAICTCVGVCTAAVTAITVWLGSKRVYRAACLLRIAEEQPYLVEPHPEDAADKFIESQLGLIRSQLVLGPVVSQLEIARLQEVATKQEPADALASSITVARAFGNEHYHIKCTSKNPQNAAMIANAVVESYMALVQTFEAKRSNALINLLESEREVSERQVDQLRENVRKMTVMNFGRDPFAAVPNLESQPVHPLFGVQNQLTTIGVEKAVVRALIKALECEITQLTTELDPGQNPVNVTEEMINVRLEESAGNDALIAKMNQVLLAKRFRLHELNINSEATEENQGEIALCKNEIERTEKVLAELRDALRPSIRQKLEQEQFELRQEAINNRKRELAAYEEQLNKYSIREEVLQEDCERRLSDLKDLKGKTLELEVRRAELQHAQRVLDAISERAFNLKTEQRTPARVSWIERADVPKSPAEGMPLRLMLYSSLAVFLAPFVLALMGLVVATAFGITMENLTRPSPSDAPQDEAVDEVA